MSASDGASGAAEQHAPAYEEQLALTGLATRLASPALIHGLKGRLHNLSLLTELLKKETSTQADAATLRAVAARRIEALRAEIHALRDQVQVLEALASDDGEDADTVCDVRASLQALLPTARYEAARRRIVVRLDLDPAVERIRCAPRAFQHLVLTFLTQSIRHCAEQATLTVQARRAGDETRIEFGCDHAMASPTHAFDRKLMALLARKHGAGASEGATLGLDFRNAP